MLLEVPHPELDFGAVLEEDDEPQLLLPEPLRLPQLLPELRDELNDELRDELNEDLPPPRARRSLAGRTTAMKIRSAATRRLPMRLVRVIE